MLKRGAGCPAATNSLTREQAMSSRRASSRRVVWFPNEFSDVVWIAVEFRLYYKPFAGRPASLLSHIFSWSEYDDCSNFR
jgi:hypothetical protein